MTDLNHFLMNHTWRFARASGEVIAPVVQFLPRGVIGGYINGAERGWELRGNDLALLDESDMATTLFTHHEHDALGLKRLVGRFLLDQRFVHVLDRVHMPSPRDLGQESAQELPEMTVSGSAALGQRRRNLVVVRANEKSIHGEWVVDLPPEERSWDLCISWYGRTVPDPLPPCEYFTHQPQDRKYGAIHALFLGESPLLDYEYVWLPDDDLATSWRQINRLFSIMRRHDLDLAQPSLDPAGEVLWDVTRHNPEMLLRYTNFVEVMCPAFSQQALRRCLPTMNGSLSGFGLDHIWPRLLGGVATRMAVIDDVMVNHTRPFGKNYDMADAEKEDEQLRDLYGAKTNFEDCGTLLREKTQV